MMWYDKRKKRVLWRLFYRLLPYHRLQKTNHGPWGEPLCQLKRCKSMLVTCMCSSPTHKKLRVCICRCRKEIRINSMRGPSTTRSRSSIPFALNLPKNGQTRENETLPRTRPRLPLQSASFLLLEKKTGKRCFTYLTSSWCQNNVHIDDSLVVVQLQALARLWESKMSYRAVLLSSSPG